AVAMVVTIEARRADPIAGEDNRKASPAQKAAPPAASPAELALAKEIDSLIDESDLKQARWGVCVISLKDQRVVYARDSDKLFMPASNMKIYTTAAGLDLLGGEYRWRTS